MSASEPNDPGAAAASAYRELEAVVRHLTDELGSFRRRALAAEARLRAQEQAAAPAPSDRKAAIGVAAGEAASSAGCDAGARVTELERENAELRRRVEQAGTRTRRLLERVRFLRQQHEVGGAS